MSKKIKGSYLLNAVGVALVFALLTGLFAANVILYEEQKRDD